MHIQIDLRNRDKAIKRIDSAIKLLEDTKEDLIKMDKHMDAAKKKAEKVTIQKLRKMHTVVIADTETVLSDDQDARISSEESSLVVAASVAPVKADCTEVKKPA